VSRIRSSHEICRTVSVGRSSAGRGSDAIHEDVCRNGFHHEIGNFVQAYGSKALDASLLLLPIVSFLPPSDPRIVGPFGRSRLVCWPVGSSSATRQTKRKPVCRRGRRSSSHAASGSWTISFCRAASPTRARCSSACLLFATKSDCLRKSTIVDASLDGKLSAGVQPRGARQFGLRSHPLPGTGRRVRPSKRCCAAPGARRARLMGPRLALRCYKIDECRVAAGMTGRARNYAR
jgi:hypothetical protein